MKREITLYVVIVILAIIIASMGGYIVGANQQFSIPGSKTPFNIFGSTNGNTLQQRTLVVTGVGLVGAEPNMAQVSLGVFTEAPTAAEAVQRNAEKMSNVINALKAIGISEEDMETQHYELQPITDYDSKPPRVVGYRARNVITVNVHKLDETGQVIDVAVEAGANEVQGVTFTLTDVESQRLKFDALRKAAEDAKAKASAIASALDVKIAGVLQISEGSVYYQPYRLDVASGEMLKTPILPRDVQMSATIQVTYLIQP